jgi:hypothetical protein
MKPINENPNAVAKIVTLNRAMVDSLLACNTKNRNIRKSVVDRYMRDMKNGNWELTHQGIALSDDNVLIDGQHRLMAIRELGYIPIQSLLVTGLRFSSQKNVDQQAKRSMRDVLKIAFDTEFAASAPAIAKAIQRDAKGNASLTADETISVVEQYFDEIEMVCSNAKDRFFATAYLAGFVLCAKANPNDWDKIAEFMHAVQTGEMLSRTMPAFHLRNLVINTRGSNAGGIVIVERLRKSQKAAQAFIDGQQMGVLRA